jgi:hypothetical protein
MRGRLAIRAIYPLSNSSEIGPFDWPALPHNFVDQLLGQYKLSAARELTWVDWFNHRWFLEPMGKIPPAEAEKRYFAMLDKPATAA